MVDLFLPIAPCPSHTRLYTETVSQERAPLSLGVSVSYATVANSQRLGRLEQKVLLAAVEADKSELTLWADFFHRF